MAVKLCRRFEGGIGMGPGLGEVALDKKIFIHSSTCYIIHKCFFKRCEYRKFPWVLASPPIYAG